MTSNERAEQPEVEPQRAEPEQPVLSSAPQPPKGRPGKSKRGAKSEKAAAACAAREQAEQRERESRTERIRPYVEQVSAASADRFQAELDAVCLSMRKTSAKREDRRGVLEVAFVHAPPQKSGLIVAKHFKFGSDWQEDEVVAALRSLERAVVVRNNQVHELGPMLHGALICLVNAASSFKMLDAEAASAKDVIGALVSLHRAVWEPSRDPLSDLGDPRHDKVVGEACRLLSSYQHRPDVQSVIGQRLFGFARVFEPSGELLAVESSPLDSRDQSAVAAAGVAKRPEGAETPSPSKALGAATTASPVGTKPRTKSEDRIARLQGEVEKLSLLLAASEKARDRLRTDLREVQSRGASLQRALEESVRLREMLSTKIEELQIDQERAIALAGEVQAERARAVAAEQRAEQLRHDLKQSESQNSVAKESEFQRGRKAMRAAIAAHCVESLQQIEMAARQFESGEGEFVRTMAASLVKYLEERSQ
jgi:hypothetical protein